MYNCVSCRDNYRITLHYANCDTYYQTTCENECDVREKALKLFADNSALGWSTHRALEDGYRSNATGGWSYNIVGWRHIGTSRTIVMGGFGDV